MVILQSAWTAISKVTTRASAGRARTSMLLGGLLLAGTMALILVVGLGTAGLGVQAEPLTASQPAPGDSLDPVLSRALGREIYIPNSSAVQDGEPSLHASALRTTPLLGADSVKGHPITAVRDPLQDLELALVQLLADAESAAAGTLVDTAAAQNVMDILVGDTRGRVYDGFPLLNFNRGGDGPGQILGEYKTKRLTDTGRTFVSQIDGETHRIWELTINMLWYGQNLDSDTFLVRYPYEAHEYDEVQINYRIYSLISEDLAPTTILNDGFGRIFHGLDSTFESLPADRLSEISIRYPSLKHFRGLYIWGWGSHPPRVQFLQPIVEVSANGALNWAGQSFSQRTAALTIDDIGEAAPEKKVYRVAEAALAGATGDEIAGMLTDPTLSPRGTFRDWLRLADDLRQLPPEAWDVLLQEDGLLPGEFGTYDIVLAYLNNEIYGDSPYSQPGTDGKGGVLRDWEQGGMVRVKIINLDNHTHYYRNVDFGDQLSNQIEGAFGNGRFSFEKFNAKPTYGVPKVAEMQWRTGWGYVPHLGIAQQSGMFPREVDQVELAPFTDQFGETHYGYSYSSDAGYWRFNPPAAIRAGTDLPAGEPLRDADGLPGVLIGVDTEGFGAAKMPTGPITTHPDREAFPEVTFPGFLRNPGVGGDIIPPTPVWAPFLTLNPDTGTLLAPDGSYWVDDTYFHGRPVSPHTSIIASVEAPRASAQLFYQFDPLFHDNMIFSYHPRSDIIR